MNLYFEKRIETRGVFCSLADSPTIIRSIPRTVLTIRGGFLLAEVKKAPMTLTFKSEAKARAHAEKIKNALLSDGFRAYAGPQDPALERERDALFASALDTLSRLAREKPETAAFPPAVDSTEWDLVEVDVDSKLSPSYRSFTSLFNGGAYHASRERPESFLYSIQDARAADEHLRLGPHAAAYAKRRVFPIGESGNGERLVLATSPDGSEETPVLDAFHELTPERWQPYFPSFADLLICFVERRDERSPFYTPAAYHWEPPRLEAEGVLES